MSTDQIDYSSAKLVTITKNHYIYYVTDVYEKFALKVIKSRSTKSKETGNLDNEYNFTKCLRHPSIRKSRKRVKYKGKDALLLDWVNGYPISRLRKEEINISDFFLVAKEIVSCLIALHHNEIMHLRLSCEHVIFDEVSRSVQLIGLGEALEFNSKSKFICISKLNETEIHYFSPEQTGMIMQDIDFRSDFYGLGMIFYRLLSGGFPFTAQSPYKLIQMYMLKDVEELHNINDRVPLPLSKMVSKLLSRDACDRYQSAQGIMHDLHLIMTEINSKKDFPSEIPALNLGQHDHSKVFLLPQNFYGREKELVLLHSGLKEFKTASISVSLISGSSGTGKSRMVRELHTSILERNGFFLTGKFDVSRPRPLAALLEAIQKFFDTLNLLSSDFARIYKSKIKTALGDEGKLLTNLIPNLHSIMGEQPHISPAFGSEAKNRFNYVLLKFFKAICEVSFPIFLVLEDLQWIDDETSNFLHVLLLDKSVKNMMLIGSYREEEISSNNLLTDLIECIQKSKVVCMTIKLGNFEFETVNQIVSDLFRVNMFEVYSLSLHIFRETQGNPFYVFQILKLLKEEQVIYYCDSSLNWKWHESMLDGKDLTGDVLDLLRRKILTSTKYAQQAMKVASILGSPFSIDLLKKAISHKEGVSIALLSGMIVQSRSGCGRFSHDLVHQAAHSLLPKDAKRLKFYVGKKLWKSLSKIELEDEIFTVAALLYDTSNIVENDQERFEIAILLLQAGRKAMLVTAFEKASLFLDAAIVLLNEGSWKKNYSLCLELHNLAAEAAYCLSNLERMNTLFGEISSNALGVADIFYAYHLKIRYFNDNRSFPHALKSGLLILHKLGINIDLNLIDSEFEKEMQSTINLVKNTSKEDLLSMKVMRGRENLCVMQILNAISLSSFYVNPKYLVLVAGKVVQLTFAYGISKFSSEGFCSFGHALQIQGNNYSHHFGKLALNLLDGYGRKESVPVVNTVFFGAISIWFSSIHDGIDSIFRSYRISLENGQKEVSVICANSYCFHAFQSGKNLNKLFREAEKFNEIMQIRTGVFLSTYQSIINLSSRKFSNNVLVGNEFDILAYAKEKHSASDLCRCYVNAICFSYLFHQYSFAEELSKRCKTMLCFIHGTYFFVIYVFYSGLVYLARAKETPNNTEMLQNARECITILKRYGESAPENFRNKVHLLEAEQAAVNGNKALALFHYKESISLAKKNLFIHEEATASERLGIYLRNDSILEAIKHVKHSCCCYGNWGALAKLYQLMNLFPSLASELKEISYSFDGKSFGGRQCSVSQLSDASFSTCEIEPKQKRVRFK